MISVAAKNATIRAVEAAQEKTPPTADSLSGINTRTGWYLYGIRKGRYYSCDILAEYECV